MARQHAPRERVLGPRAQAMRQRVLDAAQELVRSQGVPGFDTKALALYAGVSIGTVYRFWRNKHEILRELDPELLNLETKVLLLQELGREAIPDEAKWQRTRQIFDLP